jgi:hypothetical protein
MDTFLIEKFTPPINCAFVPSTRDFGGAKSGQAVLNSVLNSVKLRVTPWLIYYS